MYDLIIIGSGPAGMTAGMYAARREMKTLIIGSEIGGQLVWASEIESFPGFKLINSFELIDKMKDQAISSGAELKIDSVKKIERLETGNFQIFTNREVYDTQAVIIATGLSPRRLIVPGEIEYGGKGVSYCANCDGPFFKNKVVSVIGGGNSALDAAETLSKIASKVYLVNRTDKLKAFESLIVEVETRQNIEIILNAGVKEILGDGKVEKLKIINFQDNSEREIAVDGIFVEVGRIASTDLVGDFVDRNDKAQIIVNEKCETRTPGLYAAGDVTSCEIKQITVAVGQATIATLNAYQYLRARGSSHFVIKKY